MQLKPMQDWAVIRPSDAQEMTASGLYIPDTAKDKPYEGTVVAIGPGAYEERKYRQKKEEQGKERKFIPTTVKPGDLVLYEQYAGQSYTIDNEELVLVRERDMLGIMLEKPARINVKPLQIPAVTTASTATALAKRPAAPLMKSPEKREKKSAKEPAPKPAAKKKAAKKAVKKTSAKKGQGAGGKGTGKPQTATKAIAKKTVAKKGKKPGKKK